MFRTSFIFLIVIFLTACGMQNMGVRTSPFEPYNSATITNDGRMMPVARDQNMSDGTMVAPTSTSSANGKVAILLPLSGQHVAVGKSMLDAAQLALFDINDDGFELLPFDTKGTTTGASQAVSQAAAQGAKLILGPLLANNVEAAGISARQHNLQIVGFTTDSTKVGNNVMTLGILPYDQGKRMAQYARQSGLNRVVIINPNNQYANAVISAFEQTARTEGLRITNKINFQTPAMANQIAGTLSAKRGQFDAIFMPVGNPQLHTLTSALTDNGLGANMITWLGAGLWDDRSIQSNQLMQGALYAAPALQQRTNFERQYRSVYGQNPKRLASLAYDATALSIVLLRQNNQFIGRNALMNPNGFAGIDGIFRFQSNGLAERGLAVHKITGAGRTAIIDQAPTSFQMQVSER